MLNPGHEYYVVVQEWLYPTETGIEKPEPLAALASCTDDIAAAREEARGLAETAAASFAQGAGTDPTPVEELADRYPDEAAVFLVTAKNGLDEWWFAAKVVKVTFGVGAALSAVKKTKGE
jgi:hypothetical protein